ncbi:MAG: helix-turn-helix domain-containing protein [Verrucomicrobiales bacterium]|nr:helix-turn-helix domain-containing protein [Verrucomicrobiales bacterium]
MSTVAEQLRHAREAQGLSLRDLADLTKIRSDHLEALEQANYAPFPAPVYIRGSVRTCASFLKLDVQSVLDALDAELANSPEFREPPSLTGERRGPLDWITYQLSRINWRLTLIVVTLLTLLAGGSLGWKAWSQRSQEDPLSRLGPGLYRGPAPAESDVLAIPTLPPPATNPPSRR